MENEKEVPGSSTSAEAWREVGQQFANLGKSLAEAFGDVIDDEATHRAVREVESGLQSVARAVAGAVDEAAASAEGKELRADAERVVGSAARVGSEAIAEARPQLIAALHSVRDGLRAAVEHLTEKPVDSDPEDSDTPS